ncbi:MAG: DNA recombination protein RmuC, partial [Muribaculaceae bacterium]|nr:DNA recombination protein RmuC [Muribaculaceae bacterium]
YTDFDFRKVVELAAAKNIIIVGSASLLVTLRLVNQLWASQTQYDNVQNIITVGENLYNNIATHAQNLLNIEQLVDKAASGIKTELNRMNTRNNGSIFKEAEKLRQFGIASKEIKSGKKITENNIPESFLSEENTRENIEI